MADTPHRIQRILVAVDGSPPSAAALQWAIAMAVGMKAEVVAAYVMENLTDLSFGLIPVAAAQYNPEWRGAMEVKFTQEWCAPLTESGVSHRTELADGRPATEITRLADEVDADVVVLGRRGRGGVAELLLGSVSHEVAQHCKRPVLLISG